MKMKNGKYKYWMCGCFIPTDGEEYEINMPSPNTYDTEEDAMMDESFGYRFLILDDKSGPELIIFERENYKVDIDEDGNKYLEQWVEGNVIHTYNYDEFKKAGGYIRMLKPECKGLGFVDAETDYIDINKTFKDVFPNAKKQKMYYVDSNAYSIETISE